MNPFDMTLREAIQWATTVNIGLPLKTVHEDANTVSFYESPNRYFTPKEAHEVIEELLSEDDELYLMDKSLKVIYEEQPNFRVFPMDLSDEEIGELRELVIIITPESDEGQ